jgi:hypothetical protein
MKWLSSVMISADRDVRGSLLIIFFCSIPMIYPTFCTMALRLDWTFAMYKLKAHAVCSSYWIAKAGVHDAAMHCPLLGGELSILPCDDRGARCLAHNCLLR